jgi:hypothetical protein
MKMKAGEARQWRNGGVKMKKMQRNEMKERENKINGRNINESSERKQ